MSSPIEVGGDRMLLRTSERRLLVERDDDEQFVKVVRCLGRTRFENTYMGDADWRTAYEKACEAIEHLLRKADGLERHIEETGRHRLFDELERLRVERDDAKEQAKHAFAMGRRSA